MSEHVPVEELTAADVMSQILLTVEPTVSPVLAWELMSKAGIHHLPVVNDQGAVLGVLTAEELAVDWSGGPTQQDRRHVGDLLRGLHRPRGGPEESLASIAGTMLHTGRDAGRSSRNTASWWVWSPRGTSWRWWPVCCPATEANVIGCRRCFDWSRSSHRGRG